MKRPFSIIFYCFTIFALALLFAGATGCANMIPPTGGKRDSLPPVLVESTPRDLSTHFTGNRIALNFDEFVQLENAFENVIVSPTPNSIPIITTHFRTVNIKIKDTLEPNTTYSINFGNGLKDINEGNIAKNFTFVFSTGNKLDTNSISGKVVLAETGKIDTTLIVVLQRNLDDSAVVKEKPRYITKLDGKGRFQFRNLAAGTFAMYALPNDYSKRYDDTTKLFAFASNPINSADNSPVTLYAYQLPKHDTATVKPKAATPTAKGKEDKQLKFVPNFDGGRQDLLKNLVFSFNRKIATIDSSKIKLYDQDSNLVTNYKIIPDTNRTKLTLLHEWPENKQFKLIFLKDAFVDTAGATLAKNDTIKFFTKRAEDYGSVRLRFKNLDLTKNPVLQIVQNDKVVDSIPLTKNEWTSKLYEPGEYELRILFDSNKNGKWDPGKFFGEHLQPEVVLALNKKFTFRANWDNEFEIAF